MSVLTCIIISLIISAIVCGFIASGYKFHARTSTEAYTKSENGSDVRFTHREDVFIKTYTTKTKRDKN